MKLVDNRTDDTLRVYRKLQRDSVTILIPLHRIAALNSHQNVECLR